MEAALNQSSTLLAYFDLNKQDISARQYTYAEISAHYVFNNIMIMVIKFLDGQNENLIIIVLNVCIPSVQVR